MPGPPITKGPFTMPMMNGFVPRKLQPWIYVCFAAVFQLSGGIYGAAIANIMGDTCLMREDVVMITLCGVVGVNMPFPFLFRFKFRFTNQQLLTTAAVAVALCDLLAMTTECVPLLCLLGYVAGFFKLCGTFECMSNIQLWMTPKRDFAIFFPLLYCLALGSKSVSPWLTVQLTYALQSWHAMQLFMAGLLLTLALLVRTITHPFRFMKPLPLISLDWLGCALWSVLMVEVIFLFNYGEYYNWWDGRVWRTVLCFVPVTAYMSIQRMRHIRHPYIAWEAWKYKRLVPLLALFFMMEMISSTPKVMQTAFTASVLRFGTMQTTSLYLFEFAGTICGCLSVMAWIKVLRYKFTRLLAVGFATQLAYEVAMFFIVSPGVPLSLLYPPVFLRAYGIAVFFTALTIYLEELMPFQHFFMGLTMVGLVRNGLAETVCSGIYSFALRHHVADTLVRGMDYEPLQAMMIGLKQLFGTTCAIGTAVFFVFLLWDVQPVRSTLKRMPYWNVVGRMTKKMAKAAKASS